MGLKPVFLFNTMKFILGKKIGMSQVFDDKGKVIPVTVIDAGPCFITQIRTSEKDNYEAVQVGYGEKKKLAKPIAGHLKKIKVSVSSDDKQDSKTKSEDFKFRYFKEFKDKDLEIKDYKLGDKIDLSVFEVGDDVKISGISKGKGFQGVVKRHGFHGAPASHGTKHNLRAPGSIGSAYPQHVFKGKKMAGRMGTDRITIKGLKVVSIDKEKNLLAVSGALPGRRGTLLEIRG